MALSRGRQWIAVHELGAGRTGSGGFGPQLILSPNGPYSSGNWAATALTETTGQTDPFAGTTASLMTDTAVASVHQFGQNISFSAGASYRIGLYFKPGTFTTGVDINPAQTNGGGGVHISNTGVITDLTGGQTSNFSTSSVGGFFLCSWKWVPLLSGIGSFTVSFGAGTNNAPLSYTGTVQNHTFWGISARRIL